jgi:hypothetical protein
MQSSSKILLVILALALATAVGVYLNGEPSAAPTPENTPQLRVPMPAEEQEPSDVGELVEVYLYDAAKDTDADGNIRCSSEGLVAVERTVPRAGVAAALRELLQGTRTDAERDAGLTTEFPLSGVTLERVEIIGGIATLTFADPMHATSGGACRASILRAQMEATVLQFPEVGEVRILPDDVFQP